MSFFDRKKKDNDYSNESTDQPDVNVDSFQNPQNQQQPQNYDYNQQPQSNQNYQQPEQQYQYDNNGPEVNGNYYEEQPVPEALDTQDWVYTQDNLENTLTQTENLKSQLRHELLADRGYCNHVLRSVGSDQVDEREAASKRITTINEQLRKWFDTDEMANEIYLDPNRNYFIFTDQLNPNPEDNVSKLWQQITQTLMEHNLMANAISVTYDDQVNQTWMNYQNAGWVDPNSYLLSMYNDLQGRSMNMVATPAEIPFEESYRIQHVNDKTDKILDADDNLVMEVSRTSNQQLQVIRHYNDSKLLSRDIFDVNGVISATQFYDHHDPNKVVRENFYRQDGTLVLIKSYTNDEPYIQLFTQGNVLISTFDTDEGLIIWWLKNQALRQVQATIFVSVDSEYYKKLLSLRDNGFEVIPVVMTQDQNAKVITDLVSGKDKVTAVFAGTDKVNSYLNTNSTIKMDISTLSNVETPVYKQ
ncbi:hypothetical protein M5C72_01975 [Companilactobacillus allii]|uniref:Uncharacterized protein n=1 Tax=Companilactobacillus allii TaxID=1847728 RepID=A0A1P8Q229_9LACO|nr:hypothetical protein [Companilactobacillus allii]APX71932.1 hypothetical protein BTM29_04895 [Companilactobacillus allii]USQ69026.1 hypothetical protein M5C72_01975 [Companilactobacillus allii]